MDEVIRYKCHNCKFVIEEGSLIGNTCPVCGTPKEDLTVMCKRDHCHCPHEIVSGIAFCPDCGENMCPICDGHDVFAVSRVTGYLAELNGYNEGKRQEIKDRVHYNV